MVCSARRDYGGLLRRLALVTVLVMVSGCQWKGGPGGTRGVGGDGKESVWEVRPASMRIYPSSGFRVISGQPALEARIELFDDLGDSVKGVGTVRFELYPVVGPERSDVGARLYGWEVEMLTLAKNREHYDSVTRTYVFQLRLGQPPQPGKPLRLVAEFADAHHRGERLSADTVLEP